MIVRSGRCRVPEDGGVGEDEGRDDHAVVPERAHRARRRAAVGGEGREERERWTARVSRRQDARPGSDITRLRSAPMTFLLAQKGRSPHGDCRAVLFRPQRPSSHQPRPVQSCVGNDGQRRYPSSSSITGYFASTATIRRVIRRTFLTPEGRYYVGASVRQCTGIPPTGQIIPTTANYRAAELISTSRVRRAAPERAQKSISKTNANQVAHVSGVLARWLSIFVFGIPTSSVRPATLVRGQNFSYASYT